MKASKIYMNDVVVSDFSLEVVDGDIVSVYDTEGSPFVVGLSHVQEKYLISFHKPVGYVVSLADGHNQTIYDILPSEFSHFRYIGRLDKNSRGLLLLSNDLDLVHRYSHPSFASEKEYIIQVDRNFSSSDSVKAQNGIADEGEILRAVRVDVQEDPCMVRIVLQEGKNRHIRRMIAALGYDVLDLCRVSQGDIVLGDLAQGDWRYEPL